MLWTRLAPDPLAPDGAGGMPPYQLPVTWQVARDPQFRRVVRAGTVRATPELGHSVHAEVSGLEPGRDHWYRFRAGDQVSPVGRARTAPPPSQTGGSIAFALASCQAWAGGRFASYRTMAEEDLDLVVHVGDYTYEGRDDETLAQFRVNHAKYKTSPDLQAAHAAFPFVVTFDDHEIENNWAAGVSQPDGRGVQRARPLPAAAGQRLPGLLRAPAAAPPPAAERAGHPAAPPPRLRPARLVPRARHPAVPLRPAHRGVPRRPAPPGRQRPLAHADG